MHNQLMDPEGEHYPHTVPFMSDSEYIAKLVDLFLDHHKRGRRDRVWQAWQELKKDAHKMGMVLPEKINEVSRCMRSDVIAALKLKLDEAKQ